MSGYIKKILAFSCLYKVVHTVKSEIIILKSYFILPALFLHLYAKYFFNF